MSAKQTPGTWVIDGEMTIYTAAALKQTLLSKLASSDDLTIDLGQVSEIDSAGFQLLLLARHEAQLDAKQLQFTHINAAVSDVLALYNTDLSNLEQAS